MEALYIKLYEKYSKSKVAKDAELEKVNKEQELKFVDFVSAAESLIEHLTAENKRLFKNLTDLQNEFRTAKEQQFVEFQELLKKEREKNQQLSAENEQLRNMQHERPCNSNRSDGHEDQHVNSTQHSASASGSRFNESPRRSTRKRARPSIETNVTHSPPAPDHVVLSEGRSSANHSRKVASKILTLPECCQSGIAGAADPCKCVFQRLVECLVGMAISVVHKPEGMFIHASHQSSGYSFSLKLLDNTDKGEEALLYDVSSLGTFAKVAPEWMREVIIFNMSMLPMFFEKVSRVIKQC